MIVQSTVDLRFDRASPEADGGHGWIIVSIQGSVPAPAGPFRLTGTCQVRPSSSAPSGGDGASGSTPTGTWRDTSSEG